MSRTRLYDTSFCGGSSDIMLEDDTSFSDKDGREDKQEHSVGEPDCIDCTFIAPGCLDGFCGICHGICEYLLAMASCLGLVDNCLGAFACGRGGEGSS